MLLFALFRTAIADYNPIPSGSMHPNILEGDVVLVNRLAYQLKVPLTDIIVARLGEPRRGDIVTFSSPRDGTRLIKRVIGLPGDVVEMHGKRLSINGRAADYQAVGLAAEAAGVLALRMHEQTPGGRPHDVQWLDHRASIADFGPVTIPADHYLMLGDNRDNSADSRYIGLVRRDELIGRATRILVSADITGNWLPRFDRFGMSLYE
ncbi:MAG: signal peptidase I [Gammaproteobacteria bacterium]|nr:signal peptidase I [Gammaproteobacteria bacterium]MBU1416694.1 signal peptidase I [Gammaproteobacteria bacterium]